ncbi:MAG: hypothetical protein AMXMBFR84_17500 [Candidatus Hydrogenedentota bacterium]
MTCPKAASFLWGLYWEIGSRIPDAIRAYGFRFQIRFNPDILVTWPARMHGSAANRGGLNPTAFSHPDCTVGA